MESKTKWKAILLFGMPGSGKGTQGKALGGVPGFLHVASGDIFRQLSKLGQYGREVAKFTAKGLLVPDDLTVSIWRTHMGLLQRQGLFEPEHHVIILDGLPRTYHQAQLITNNLDVLRIFYLKLRDDEEAVHRIKVRALKENRIDDANEDVIRRRLQTFYQETASTLSFYDQGIIDEIDASRCAMHVLYELSGRVCKCVERNGSS